MMNCDAVQAVLETWPETPAAWSAEVHANLRDCAACQAHLRLLRELPQVLLEGVLEDVAPLAPPPALRAQVLDAARRVDPVADPPPAQNVPPRSPARSPSRRGWRSGWRPLFLGSAAVVGGLLAFAALTGPSRGVARALPDPAVVVNVGGPLVVASNGARAAISVLEGGRVASTLDAGGHEGAWFTEGVRLGDRVFLADAANDRVLEVQPRPLRVLREYPVPDGVAGLTATTDGAGGRVYFKGARGEVGQLGVGGVGGRQVTIARESGMPLADVMDAVLLAGDFLFVTHHVSGEVCLLDPRTLEVRRRVKVGGMPVALDFVRGGVLVLDVTGRLIELDVQGAVRREWKVPGKPDKLGVNADVAMLTDRSGLVTSVNLTSGALKQTRLSHPMDVTPVGGGFALALGDGVRVLDGDLRTRAAVGGGR